MDREYTKAVIYCRVSSEKQVKEGNGLDSQEHRCREYANTLGVQVGKVFRDEGISGGLFDRPAMQALIDFLDENWQNKYIVIFDDLKRFARDVGVHLKLKSELRCREAKLRCLNYNFDDSAEGEFVETIFAAQNELERKQNKRQVCQKMKARIERGYWCFYPPTGYEYIKDKDHGKILSPISSITSIIAEGLRRFSDDQILDQVDLLKYFLAKGLHRKMGKKTIHFEFVKRILTEPIYAGLVEYTEWGISRRQGHHKAIVTEEVFDNIQDKLNGKKRMPGARGKYEYPLRRVVNCAICGKKMTGSANRSKNPDKYYPHYTCGNKECPASPKSISKTRVENDYLQLLELIKVDPKLFNMAKEILMRMWNDKTQRIQHNNDISAEEIERIEKQIDELLIMQATASSESIKIRIENKIESLDRRVKELKGSLKNKKEPDFEEALDLTFNFLGTPAEAWEKSDTEMKYRIHGMIFEENPVYCADTGFGTPKLSLPFYIKDYVMGQNNELVVCFERSSNYF